MKALAWFGKMDVRIIDSPIPDITQPEDVIVRVTGTTICGMAKPAPIATSLSPLISVIPHRIGSPFVPRRGPRSQEG
jgi:hypothetical protein